MRITDKQQEILNNLICERLSANPDNNEIMKSFQSIRGKSLVDYCNTFGFDEDDSGETAYYIIKTKAGQPLMFFSLKCGALFETLDDEHQIIENKQNLLVLLQAVMNIPNGGEDAKKALELLSNNDIRDLDAIIELIRKLHEKNDYLNALTSDKQKEDNKNIYRVARTHPGIELVHFCTNEDAKEYWKSLEMRRPMGETLFWQFIAPKFFEVRRIIGCEYAFLFAADLSEDGTLLNYYDVSLKFQRKMDVGANKPFYDFGCVFVCQEINTMKQARNEFFDSFNIDDEEDIV